ncbi:hypothetical protein [Streptomyces sp. NPDC001137]|uniref:hypothetical protein n=1 Tax=Streptomyces sp. NPDC001137 TaxID=3154378 RepID=UPI00331AD348
MDDRPFERVLQGLGEVAGWSLPVAAWIRVPGMRMALKRAVASQCLTASGGSGCLSLRRGRGADSVGVGWMRGSMMMVSGGRAPVAVGLL